MSTSQLYHAFGTRGYRYVRTARRIAKSHGSDLSSRSVTEFGTLLRLRHGWPLPSLRCSTPSA
jgi:hypothetical protein